MAIIRFSQGGDFDPANSLLAVSTDVFTQDGSDPRLGDVASWLRDDDGVYLTRPETQYLLTVLTPDASTFANRADDGLLFDYRTQLGHVDLTGGARGDLIYGGHTDDVLHGAGGDDRLIGGDGADVLDGGAGADTMRGGAGADVFRFSDSGDASPVGTPDRIVDFSAAEGDTIDISALDSAFVFRGASAFTGNSDAVEIRVVETSPGRSVVRVDVDGDKVADLKFVVLGDAPGKADFTVVSHDAAFASDAHHSEMFDAPLPHPLEMLA